MSEPSCPLPPISAVLAMLFAMRPSLALAQDVIERMETGVHLGEQEHPVDIGVARVPEVLGPRLADDLDQMVDGFQHRPPRLEAEQLYEFLVRAAIVAD